MSFKSLLFCPDEKTARVVTQVLSELDFTVEAENQSFVAVKRLTEEHFDALVVDCENEQDASLLFKAARNSTHNSSSLSVAVVEGQAGVAKAFRIGANLVLTKPINVEQSKSTLRVARGLLKKTQARPVTPGSAISGTEPPVTRKPTEEFFSKPSVPSQPSFDSAVSPAAASSPSPIFGTSSPPISATPRPTVQASSVPFSGLVLENDEPEPIPQAEDLALLESLPEISGKRSAEAPAPTLLAHAGPIAASTSGQAAATALAPEKKVLDFRTAGAAPMVTNEAIVSTTESSEAFNTETFEAPTFSALESASRSSAGGGRFLKIAVVLALVAVGGYFAWQQPVVQQSLQQLHHGTEAQATPASAEASDSTSAPESVTIQPPIETMPSAVEAPASSPAVRAQSVQQPSHAVAQKIAPTEDIELQELPIARDSGKAPIAPKPQPIVVKNDTATEKPRQPTAPPVNLVSDPENAKLPNLTPTNLELPKAAPGTIRISQGVSQGLLVKKVKPVYPPLARQFQKQGTVQLLATITKYGDVSKIQVLGGDPLLAKAAVDAVKQWEYRPYLLNGLPVEIETQISIIFKEK